MASRKKKMDKSPSRTEELAAGDEQSITQKGQMSGHDHQVAMWIGLFLAAVYLATGAFHFFAIDEIATFALTRSLLTSGAAHIDILAWVGPLMDEFSVSATGVDGHVYAIKDVAPSVLMIPLAGLGYLFHVSPVRVVYLLPIVVTAFSGTLLYLLIRHQNYSSRTAILGALLFGLGSMAFPYAKVLFTQPVASLGLLIGLWGALRARDTQRPGPAFVSGAGIGIAALSAAPTWVTAPVCLAYLAFRPDPSGTIRRVRSMETMRLLLAWGSAAGLFAIIQAAYNVMRFGSPLETGHQLIGASMDLSYVGLASWAQLISTPRGLIWFAPFVVLVPFSLVIGHRQGRLTAQLMLLLPCLLVLLIYSAYFNWSAGVSLGPRYLVMVMPHLVLVTVPLLDSFLTSMRLWRRFLVGAVLILSALTQLGSSLLDYSRAEDHMYQVLSRFTPPPGFFAWSPELFAPANLIQLHLLRAIQHGWWDVLWMSRGGLDWPMLGGNIALIALALAGLVITARSSLTLPRRFLAGQTVLTVALICWMIGSYPFTVGYAREAALPDPDLDAAIGRLNQQAAPGDGVIVTFFPENNLAWLESPLQTPPDVGLPLESPLRETSIQLLDYLPDWHSRVWVVSQDVAPGDPQNGAEAWLASRAFAGAEVEVPHYRLVPFTFGSGSLSLDPTAYTFENGKIRLLGYASELDGARGSSWLNVWLRWEAAGSLSDAKTVFVHLMDSSGVLVAQHDGTPQAGYAPTLTWRPDTPVDDRHNLRLPAGLPPGDYALAVGLYDSVTGEPLPPDGGSGNSVILTHLHIEPGNQ
jgi:hypothetical protein